MAKEDVQRFYEALSQNEELQKKFMVLNEIPAEARQENIIESRLIPLAKEAGFDFTLEELKEYSQSQKKPLSNEELAAVTGGKVGGNMTECICVIGGGGSGRNCTCACVAYGLGQQTDVYPQHECICGLYGYGALVKH